MPTCQSNDNSPGTSTEAAIKKVANFRSSLFHSGGMNEIIPNLYLCGIRDATDPEQLARNNIKYIVSVHDMTGRHEAHKNIQVLRIRISDTADADLSRHFSEAIQFIHEARINGSAVVVHCLAGISRSASIVAAYLIVVCGLTFFNSLSVISAKRPAINPNFGFRRQLSVFEKTKAPVEREYLRQMHGQEKFDRQWELDRRATYSKMSSDESDVSDACDGDVSTRMKKVFGSDVSVASDNEAPTTTTKKVKTTGIKRKREQSDDDNSNSSEEKLGKKRPLKKARPESDDSEFEEEDNAPSKAKKSKSATVKAEPDKKVKKEDSDDSDVEEVSSSKKAVKKAKPSLAASKSRKKPAKDSDDSDDNKSDADNSNSSEEKLGKKRPLKKAKSESDDSDVEEEKDTPKKALQKGKKSKPPTKTKPKKRNPESSDDSDDKSKSDADDSDEDVEDTPPKKTSKSMKNAKSKSATVKAKPDKKVKKEDSDDSSDNKPKVDSDDSDAEEASSNKQTVNKKESKKVSKTEDSDDDASEDKQKPNRDSDDDDEEGEPAKPTPKRVAHVPKNNKTEPSSKPKPASKTKKEDNDSDDDSDDKKKSVNKKASSDSSSDTSVEDDEENKKKRKKSLDTNKSDDKKTKKDSSAKTATEAAAIRLQKLKKMVVAAGFRFNYKKLFADVSTDKQRNSIIEKELEKKGLTPPFTIENCRAAKLKKEEEQELAELQSNEVIEISGPSRRRVTRGQLANLSETNPSAIIRKKVTVDSDEETDSAEEEEPKANLFKNLNSDIFSNDSD